MLSIYFRIITILFLFTLPVIAEESDSTDIKINIDSTEIKKDSSEVVSDTLSPAQRAYQLFQERERERLEEKEEDVKRELKDYISYYDTLVAYFASERLNQREMITQSFHKDAGDYFRMNPSYALYDNQQTPMRKTVQPFGLQGNRLNVIYNGISLSPFEHVIEPDGLTDLNDIPTALDNNVYLLPGGSGQVFGGRQSVATLLTVSKRPESTSPESSLLVDKGGYDYAFTRGRYSKLFSNGKEIDVSIDYRSTSGIRIATDDNSYQYTGKTKIPLNETYDLIASGTTMRRNGTYVIRPDYFRRPVFRSRTERNGLIAIEKQAVDGKSKLRLGYLYKKQNSNLDISFAYKGRFNYFENGLVLARESIHGQRLFKTELELQHLKYSDGYDSYDRDYARASMSLMHRSGSWSYALIGGTEYMKTYNTLPFGALLLMRESDRSLYMVSIGYSQKAPSMHDLNLKYQSTNIYSTVTDYAEQGNDNLEPETQLIGSMTYQYGSLENNMTVVVTGGRIIDGVNWYNTDTSINLELVRLFSPRNEDIDFVDINLTQKISIFNSIQLSGGGAYHLIENQIEDSRAYQPEYQFFAGGELHLYWKQKAIDFYGYGEIVYSGPYVGYHGETLGESPIINAGLSFSLKKFRFHYIFQNLFQQIYSVREGNTVYGRYTYYGFTWNFFN